MRLTHLRQLRGWLVRLFGVFHRGRREREFAEELESHLALHIEDNLRAGMTPEEARRVALIKLGGVTQIQELHREQRGLPMLETLGQDIRFGLRMLRKNPGFSLIAIITLALGIGANTAIFSVVNAVLLRPLPFKEPDRLVTILEMKLPQARESTASPGNFTDWKQQNTVFERLVAYTTPAFNLTGTGDPEQLRGMKVTDGFFALLGAQPLLGRDFLPEEDQPGRNNVIILSHGLWQRRFSGDANIVNQTLTLNGQQFTLIGVMPATFQFGDLNLEQAVGILTPSTAMPLSGNYAQAFAIQGRPPLPPGANPEMTNFYAVNADYFKAMGIPLRRGRLLTERDTAAAPHVAVINETMVRQMFPNEDPIGKRLAFTGSSQLDWYEIVGVVGDVKQSGLEQATPMQTYEPYAQQSPSSLALFSMTLMVRTASDPANFTAAIRRAVLQVDKEQPLSNLQTLNQLLSTSIAQRRFSLWLLGVFAVVALVLAAIGVYGVLSYAVTQRTHEIGIRMALGAARRDVLKLIVRHGMFLTLLGVALGLAASFALTRWMTTLLFSVSPTDPLTFAVIALLLALVALLACWLPARRATKVNPMVALRCE